MNFTLNRHHRLILEIFYALSVALVTLVILETLKTGVVSAYINLNYFLIFWLISAILTLYSND